MKRSLDEPKQTHGSLIETFLTMTDAFLDQKRVNVCEHMINMAFILEYSVPVLFN